MKRFDYNPPQIKMKDYIKFMEWQERREEALHKKHEEKKKKDIIKREVRALTFAEGMIIAYVAQLVLPPIWKAVSHNMGIQ